MRRIVLACFAMSSAAALAGNMSLSINGLPAIQLSGFSTSASEASSIGSQSSGAGAGKAAFQEFDFKATESAATPTLLANLATGAHFPTATVQVRTPDGSKLVAEWDLSEVFVTSLGVTNGAADPRGRDAGFFAAPETSFGLAFAKYCYKVFAADGSTVASQMCFDLATNQSS